MADEVFHDVAYKAKKREHLLAGIDEFLDAVTVLPPGEWDPSIRIEPPTIVPSQEGRKQAGGHPEAAHRAACILHLANIAIRLGRKLQYDPEKEQFVGDDEANRFVNVPMRSPWHL